MSETRAGYHVRRRRRPDTVDDVPLEDVSEKQFMQNVIEWAKWHKWRVYHSFDSRRSPEGFPDLVLVRPPVVMFVETKTEKGRVTAEQLQWLGLLMQCNQVEAVVWRPRDADKACETLAGR